LSAMVEITARSPTRIRTTLHFVSSKRHICVWQSDCTNMHSICWILESDHLVWWGGPR
jgi:hypothetical protein